MNLNKFTEKAQEAVLTAQQLAEQMSHAQIEPEHLLLALVEQSEGIVPEILRKMDVDPKPFAAALREELSRLPQAYACSPLHISRRATSDRRWHAKRVRSFRQRWSRGISTSSKSRSPSGESRYWSREAPCRRRPALE